MRRGACTDYSLVIRREQSEDLSPYFERLLRKENHGKKSLLFEEAYIRKSVMPKLSIRKFGTRAFFRRL